MDNQNQPVASPPPQTPLPNPTPAPMPAPAPVLPPSVPQRSMLQRLFSGRLNRTGYILGGLAVAGTIAVVSMALFAGLSIFLNPAQVTPILLSLAFVFLLFYGFSLSLRRLHDLNRSWWWLLLFLPSEIGTVIFLIASFVPSVQIQLVVALQAVPSFVETIFTTIRWIANIFSLYMLLWPGTSGENNYGLPTASWGIKEVLGFREPKLQEPAPEPVKEETPAY